MIFPFAGLVGLVFASQTPTPVPLDSSNVRQFLSQSGADAKIPTTADWASVGPVGDSAILLADGSEWCRIPWSQAMGLQGRVASTEVSGWSRLTPNLENLLVWSRAPTGGAIRIGAENGRGPNSTSLLGWSAQAGYRHGFARFLSAGFAIGWEETTFGPRLWTLTGDTALPGGIGFAFSGCAPVVCLELERHASLLPSQSWFQPHLDSLITNRVAGDFWSYTDSGGYSGAWERRLELRLGVFRYRASWCPGLWNGAFQSLGFWDMPAGHVRFGMGLEWVDDRAASRLQFGLAPISLMVRSPGSDPVRLDLLPIDFTIAFRKMAEFQISVQTGIRFSDPFSTTPTRTTPP